MKYFLILKRIYLDPLKHSKYKPKCKLSKKIRKDHQINKPQIGPLLIDRQFLLVPTMLKKILLNNQVEHRYKI